MDADDAEPSAGALKHRRSLGPAGSRRRRALHYTRGFLRPVVLGGLIAFLVPAVYALTVWRTPYEDIPRTANTFAVLDVAAAVVGGGVSALLLPAHPRPGEGAKNATIAALGAVGAAYGIAWLLAKLVGKDVGPYLPVNPVTLAHEMVRFLLLGAALAGLAGMVIGRVRAGGTPDDV